MTLVLYKSNLLLQLHTLPDFDRRSACKGFNCLIPAFQFNVNVPCAV